MTDSVEDIMEQIREEIDSIDQFFSLPMKPLEYAIDDVRGLSHHANLWRAVTYIFCLARMMS
jgi:hypothetical protein